RKCGTGRPRAASDCRSAGVASRRPRPSDRSSDGAKAATCPPFAPAGRARTASRLSSKEIVKVEMVGAELPAVLPRRYTVDSLSGPEGTHGADPVPHRPSHGRLVHAVDDDLEHRADLLRQLRI